MLLFKDGVAILLNTLQLRELVYHEDYKHVQKVREDFTTYKTANEEGIKKKIQRFSGGETENMLEQRLALALILSNTPDLVNSTVKPLYKVGKTPPTTRTFNWTGGEQKLAVNKRKELLDYGKKFWGNKSVDDYVAKRTADLDTVDPNAFLIIDFKEQVKNSDTKVKANPYPFEVSSKDAINYFYENNVLQFITVLNETVMIDDKGKSIIGEKYLHYLSNESVTCIQIHSKTYTAYLQKNPKTTLISGIPDFDLKVGVNYLWASDDKDEEKRYYQITVKEHGFGFVPAKRFGTETDTETNDRTCVPVINPAKSYFEDSIQTISEFALTKRLHTFPQKWQYGNKCPDCFKGYDGKTGKIMCGTCKGTGAQQIHTSSSDIITIPMPDELKDIINIDLLSTYKGPPIDLVEFQKEYGHEDLRRYAIDAVYGGDAYGRQRAMKTAKEIDVDSDSVNDALKAFGDNWSEIYEFIYTCIAISRGLGEGFECVHAFPADLKMQTLGNLLSDLKEANESGAPSHIKKSITKKITHKIYADDQREIMKIETKEKYNPFAGKTETEIAFIIANGKTTKAITTLYSHFDLIFSDLEYDAELKKSDFYEMEETMQRDLIKAKVLEYVNLIDEQEADSAATAFGQDSPESLEAQARANLKGSVGGAEAILKIQQSVASKATTMDAGVAILEEIYGFSNESAQRILGNPKSAPVIKTGAVA